MIFTEEQSLTRFWDKVDKTGAGGLHVWGGSPCWIWTASTNRDGYGKAASGKRSRFVLAHRKAWVLEHGEVPLGLFVLHHCDNPPCVNDAHLFLGTRRDNMRDCAIKGRHGTQKIFRRDFGTILHLHGIGMSTSRIAQMYEVSHASIWWILKDEVRNKRVA